MDIAENKDVDAGAYSAATDPQLVASAKAKRGPLSVGWFQVPSVADFLQGLSCPGAIIPERDSFVAVLSAGDSRPVD